MNKELFHSLEGKNIYFKQLNTEDAQAVHDYASDKDVKKFIGWNLMKSLEETTEFVKTMISREEADTHLYASVALKATDEVIGTVMLFNFDKIANKAEVGYVFHKNHWGKGYGSESLSLVSNYAFECLKLHKLHATVTDANIGSAKILEKNGFNLEGNLKDHFYIEDQYYGALLYGKLNSKQIVRNR